jgi:hypothetical protein
MNGNCFGFEASGAGGGTGPGGLPYNYGLFAQTGNGITITNTTAESSLIDRGVGTLTVDADGFQEGDSFQGTMMGIFSSLNNARITFRVKSDTVILADSGIQTLPSTNNSVFLLTLNFTIRRVGSAGNAEIVTFGTFYDIKQSNSQQQGFSFYSLENTHFDTTISNTLDVTIEWGGASLSNSIHPDIFVLNKTF